MAHELEIGALKAQARRLVLRIAKRVDGLDCGAHLADIIRPDIAVAERELETVMDRLREIDPTAPRKG